MNEFLESINTDYFFSELSDKWLTQAANLLISEWPRSFGQRCASLRDFMVDNSSTEFQYKLPISLVLVSKNDQRVVGHVSLVSIATRNDNKIENLAFLQSLVIDKSLRGKGLGRSLVYLCEHYLREFNTKQKNENKIAYTNCQNLYLTTKDQHAFYERIGYKNTDPILFFTKKNPDSKNALIMNRLITTFHQNKSENDTPKKK